MTSREDTLAVIERLRKLAVDDDRVLAAWLAGSYGTQEDDLYSDVDVHVLVQETDLEGIETGLELWLKPVANLLLVRHMFDHLYHCVSDRATRIDIWFKTGDIAHVDPTRVQVLYQAADCLRFRAEEPFDPAERLVVDAAEFWRGVSMLPVGLYRGEFVRLFHGFSIYYVVVINLLVRARGEPQARGIKTLNRQLAPADRKFLEDVAALPALDAPTLARAWLRIAAKMANVAPSFFADQGLSYPQEMQEMALRHLYRELPGLGLGDLLQEIPGA